MSKIPRVVDIFARRLQIQERLTIQIEDCIQGNARSVRRNGRSQAQHMCMQMRGVEKQNTSATSSFTGFFQQAKTREEFMNPDQLHKPVTASEALGTEFGMSVAAN